MPLIEHEGSWQSHKSPPLVPILKNMNPVQAVLSYCFKSCFNINIPLMPRSSKTSFSPKFPHKHPICSPLLPPTCAIRSTISPLSLDNPNNIGWGLQMVKLLIMQLAPVFDTFFILVPNVFLNTLFLISLSLCSSLIWETKFHTHIKQQTEC